ncbi:hypothetical protein MIR68_010953 [Amoeboaphelidium protococcarum]|nr:hypothetical protein MIR68_010953 [Amoeboaphelidium protococcarum]
MLLVDNGGLSLVPTPTMADASSYALSRLFVGQFTDRFSEHANYMSRRVLWGDTGTEQPDTPATHPSNLSLTSCRRKAYNSRPPVQQVS